MLKHHGICNTRIDGKTGLPKRSEALQFFARDDSLRVILVSIRCGGAGYVNNHCLFRMTVNLSCRNRLDLTAASRVYLLEPHWNPMIEEQALCRVHRVGQKRNVTTIRYLMRNSFEEVSAILMHQTTKGTDLIDRQQVVEIQKRKKKLAEVTFGHDPLSEGGIGIATLQVRSSFYCT
jgi:SWI/SNF-related matrix-associated actin-dependent regulator of chromatin subfamily A3